MLNQFKKILIFYKIKKNYKKYIQKKIKNFNFIIKIFYKKKKKMFYFLYRINF